MATPHEKRYIEDDLSDDWLELWAEAGIRELEKYLGKQAAFLAYVEQHDPEAAAPVNDERLA